MGIRNQRNSPGIAGTGGRRESCVSRAGTASIQMLILMVPVFFGMMGFAFDLGRIYLIRGELNQAAQAMAMSAASKLVGTQVCLDDATTAANRVVDDSTGHGAKYNFGALLIGQTTGLLASNIDPPAFYAAAVDATGASASGNTGDADGTTARHVQINIQADAPLLFWSLLSAGQSRTTSIAARAVAGISAPVCTACNIEPFATPALAVDDLIHFGFLVGQKYTFRYQCNVVNQPKPGPLNGTAIDYVLIDRFSSKNPNFTYGGNLDEGQVAFRLGAQGLLPNADLNQACVQIGGVSGEPVWATAQPPTCGTQLPTPAVAAACGVYSRFDNQNPPGVCETSVTDFDSMVLSYVPDTDVIDYDDYTAYLGNGRRLITVPIVDQVSDPSVPMAVLGFRQFLLEPNPADVVTNPGDTGGRFVALYIGTDTTPGPVPLRNGRVGPAADGSQSCANPLGPGKVVLHQ